MQHFYEFRHARPPPVMVRVRKPPEPAQHEPMKITGGKAMKHYQKLYFKHFYAQDENGEYMPRPVSSSKRRMPTTLSSITTLAQG